MSEQGKNEPNYKGQRITEAYSRKVILSKEIATNPHAKIIDLAQLNKNIQVVFIGHT